MSEAPQNAPPPAANGESGFALVMVVAMMLMVIGATAAVLSNGRSSIALAEGITARAELMARADGAVMTALAYLYNQRPVSVETDGITLEIVDMRELAQVNTASLSQLREAFLATGRPEAEAWLSAVAARRSAFDARGISWQLDARAIVSTADLAGLLGVARTDPVLDAFNTYTFDAGRGPSFRVRALASDGSRLREAIFTLGTEPVILAWD